MTPIRGFLMIVLLLGLTIPVTAQFHYSGSLQSSLYAFDTPDVEQANFYQGLQLRLSHEKLQNAYLSGYGRMAWKGKDKPDDRLYNLYANWQASSKKVQLRLGRQFVYAGVINGTVDGILAQVRPTADMTIKLLAGLEAPITRELSPVGSDSSAVGGYIDYRLPFDAKIALSYYQRQRDEETVWQLVGFGLNGTYRDNLYYHAQIDQNLKSEELQGMRYRLDYFYRKWSFYGEYRQQRPRIFEDSFFRIFQMDGFNQTRGGRTYQRNRYQLGVQYVFTDYQLDQGNQVITTVQNDWGLIGLVFQDGYGGKNVGAYGEVNYDVLPTLTLRAYSSYYNYERQTTEISEDATSFSGGAIFRPTEALALRAEVQESINSAADHDLRGLFRLSYSFRR